MRTVPNQKHSPLRDKIDSCVLAVLIVLKIALIPAAIAFFIYMGNQ